MKFKQVSLTIIGCMFFTFSHAQTQEITVNVSPQISNAINGHLEFDRSKYINIASNVNELNKVLTNEQFDRYMKEYEMSVGRALGMIFSESAWGSSIREDANRPGYIDTTYMATKLNPTDAGLDEYQAILGNNSGLALHDRGGSHAKKTYPDFMSMYTLDNGDHYFPENNKAHAELAAHLIKNKFTDFQRPQFYELVNEPHWKYYGDQHFYDFHTLTKQKFEEMNIPTEVGGPCSSVGYYYRKNFGSMSGMTDFIDGTKCKLDFYSFHIYDYMHWNFEKSDYEGSISSGLPTEAVFDALAAYTKNRYNKDFTFVGSEHGGYNSDGTNKLKAADSLAAIYFPRENFDSDFEWEMEKRSIENFVMVNSAITNTLTFMNHPHVVKKAVPFILNESSNWDPYYYSSLLVKKNFDKNNPTWVESKLIHYFNFFAGVKGHRVKSVCNDNDIQHFSFVDNDKLIMVFHNQSNVKGNININTDDFGVDVANMTIRRVGKGEDHRPYYAEETLNSLNQIAINKQESVVVFVNYTNAIPNNKTLNTIPYYSTESATEFSNSKIFRVRVPDYEQVEHAILRVGIGRQSTSDTAKEVNIYINGTKLEIPVEDAADRLTNYSSNSNNESYATTRSISFDPALLKATNQINVQFADGGIGGVGAVVIRASYDNELKVSVDDKKNSSQLDDTRIYPNPAKNNIKIDSATNGTLHIFDTTGKRKLTKQIDQGVNNIDINTLEAGLYILRINDNNGTMSQKLTIIR